MPIDVFYRKPRGTQRFHSFDGYGCRAQNFVTALVRAGFVVSVYDTDLVGVTSASEDHADDERRGAQGQ